MDQPMFGQTGGEDFDMSKLGEMLQQMGAMMSRMGDESGPVSWQTVRESARATIAKHGDPSLTGAQREAAASALTLAQTWLDGVLPFPPASLKSVAWCQSEWLESTIEQWRPLIDPIGAALSRTMSDFTDQALQGSEGEISNEAMAMLNPMLEMAKKMSGVSTGMQIGTGLGALASSVLSAGDVALPLSADCTPALLPLPIEALAREHELPVSETMLFIAVREAAIQRLFHAYPWVRQHIASIVTRYAKGIHIDGDRIRETLSEVDTSNPESMAQLAASGIFQPAVTEEQQRSLADLELGLALVEGWVDAVALTAVDGRLAALPKLVEVLNRRRAEGGPAEQTFANLVGLTLRPRLIRQAAGFWSALFAELGAGATAAVWEHPDLLPSLDELTDPESFLANRKEQL